MLMFLTIPFMEKIGDMGIVLGYGTMLVGFATIFFAARAYRNGVGGGKLGFRRAFVIGLAITGIGSLCYVGAWEVLSRKYMPDFAEKYSARMMEKARAEGKSEVELATTRQKLDEFTQNYQKPSYRMTMTLLEPLPVGLILSLIAAARLRRQAGPAAG
jgi:hypothetical protein